MNYLHPNQVLYLHKRVLEVSGGSSGVRDQGLLESAIYRPMASFGGQDLYPDIFAKAAALIHSIIKNHPFVDGNKRSGFEAMRLFLRINGLDVQLSEEKKFDWIIKIASSKLDETQIAEWIKAHSAKYSREHNA